MIFWILGWSWGEGGVPGVPGGRGFILTKFGVKRRHLEPIHARFHDFGLFSQHVAAFLAVFWVKKFAVVPPESFNKLRDLIT